MSFDHNTYNTGWLVGFTYFITIRNDQSMNCWKLTHRLLPRLCFPSKAAPWNPPQVPRNCAPWLLPWLSDGRPAMFGIDWAKLFGRFFLRSLALVVWTENLASFNFKLQWQWSLFLICWEDLNRGFTSIKILGRSGPSPLLSEANERSEVAESWENQ